jgi:hypothetical protein
MLNIFINMSCTRQHRLDHLRLKKKLLDKKKGMLQFPYEAFVDEKTNLRQHKQAKLLSLIMEYIYNDGFEYIMYQPTWAQRIDGLRRVKSFAHRLCVPRI